MKKHKFLDFLIEDGDIPINDKGERDFTGTGVKPDDAWKTPEQKEQETADAEAQQKAAEEDAIEAEKEKILKRRDLVRSKLGRLLATPEEIEELDDERDKKEELEAKKEQLRAEKEREKFNKENNIEESTFNVKKKLVGSTSSSQNKSHQDAIQQAKSAGLHHVSGTYKWADDKHIVRAEIKNHKLVKVDTGEKEGDVGKGGLVKKSDDDKSKLTGQKKPTIKPKEIMSKSEIKAEAEKRAEKEIEKKKKEKESKINKELGIKIDKKNNKKSTVSYPTKINDKDKTLDSKINTSKQKAFTDTLYDMKKGDKKFYDKNKNFEGVDISVKNKWVPPTHLLSGKVPIREVQIFTRMMNTKLISSTKPPISYFTDGGAGGAGKIQAQAGELMTMLCTSMNDKQKSEFQKSALEHLSSLDEHESIITKDWLKSSINNSNAIHNRIKREFNVDDASEIIENTCWDVQEDVEALGLKDYKKNKGFSSDIYIKIKLATGQKILNEVSLKKDKNVNFLNQTTSKFNAWDKNLPKEIDPKVYADTQKKILKSGIKKNEVQKMLQMYNTPEIKELKSMLGNKDIDKMLNGDNRESRKFMYNILKAKESYGDENASKILKKMHKRNKEYSSNAISALNTNTKLKKGMLNEIKAEFPIKSVTEKEETMAIGDMSVDPKVIKNIFGTDKWDEIQEHLTAVTDKEPPYLAYKIKGTKSTIPISTIVVREDGVGYGGLFKFEMKLDPRFAKILKDANKSLYKSANESALYKHLVLTTVEEDD
jgi:hypothetical protein